MRILIVEDEKSISDLICQYYCKPRNYLCHVAHTLAEATAAGTDYDVVVLDLNLPDSEGWPTLISMRAKFPATVQIIVMSGGLTIRDIATAIGYGAADILFKADTSMEEFAQRIDVALSRPRHPEIDNLQAKMQRAEAEVGELKIGHDSVNESLEALKKSVQKQNRPLMIF